mgnify:CR=1 FL=1|tara:strand:- start:13870 stop:16341 length:2472 start_codon:yes stop_codon:yes gene_type:complete
MSNYRIYTGNQKSLVFPIMGDGFVALNYTKHIPSGIDRTSSLEGGIEITDTVDDDDTKYGLWAHDSSFTIEAIATPYDVNGFGYLLGRDKIEGGGSPTVTTGLQANKLDLPFTDKYFSPPDNRINTSSRSSLYFSHAKMGTLAIAINDSATTLVLSSIDNIIGGSIIRMDNELMVVTSVALRNKGTQITVVRGQGGSTATSHVVGAVVQSDNRLNHKMSLFHNEACQFYLKNMTRGNMNQPAEYKIGCVLKGRDANGNISTVTVESDNPVISPAKEYYSTFIPQTTGAKLVFGEPVYFDKEDRIRYNKIITPNGSLYGNIRFGQIQTISSGTVTFSAANNTVNWSGGNIAVGAELITITGSIDNDGHYKVVSGGGTGTITLSTDIWEGAGNTGSLLIGETANASLTNIIIRYDIAKSQMIFTEGGSTNFYDGTSNVDVTNYIYRGKNLYASTSSNKIFNTNLDTTPTKLGFVSDINVHGGGKTDSVHMGVCKLTKPIRDAHETIIYVDDARSLSIGQKLVSMNVEILTITGIQGNKITVTRGSNPKTTSLNAFNKTGGATTASYIIDPREEDDFSRTLYHHSFGDLFHTLRMTADASGTSITNSDNFGVHLLTDTWMETDYVLRPFHLAMSYDKTANRISLFVDGKEISTSTFSERNIRWSTIISTGSNTATVTCLDMHGFSEDEIEESEIYVRIENASTTNHNGVWKVDSRTDEYTFVIDIKINTSGADAAATADGPSHTTLRDVTIRETNPIVDFEFDATNCYLGSNGSDSLSIRRPSQFMGELHEFAITKDYKDRFGSIDTLIPNYRKTLLYFRFEEANL